MPEESASAETIIMRLEVVVIPVSDVDRAKRFYGGLGWRLDADFPGPRDFRVVQFTPPGSSCSIQFGRRLTTAEPGSAQNLYLVVSDIVAARADLVARGAAVSEVVHRTGVGEDPVSGPDPRRQSYASSAWFSDPDRNTWLVQEVTQRLPGRVDGNTTFVAPSDLAGALRRAAAAHGEHEKRIGGPDPNWPDWYADFIAREQAGRALPT
jgi:catechol 2,3-dioxygenase-like lactoylglutathione lyase family enzyme